MEWRVCMSRLDRALRSIGKSNFVEYFEDYRELAFSKKKITSADKMVLATKLLESDPNATKLSGQIIRILSAMGIFKNGWEKDALKEVMASKHPSITKEIKAKAMTLINNME